MKGQARLFAGLATAFVALAALYSLVTPLFEAPDEVWHYAYVRYLAERRALPALTDAGSGAYQEVAQPPLYYATAALVSGLVPDDDLPALMWHNPNFGYQAGGTVNDNKNILIHTERERFPWRGAVLAIRLSRLVSLAFGLLTVVAAWGLGREAFPDQPAWALGVAAAVAFTPQFVFISGVVSNDSAAAALSTAALWAVARAANRGITPRRSFAIGLLVGLAALTKTSCLLLFLPALAPPLLSLRPTPPPLRGSSFIVHILSLIFPALAVGGWWYLRNALVYGDPLALGRHVDTPWGRATPASLRRLLRELPRLYRSFWGAFGWWHVEFPCWVYLVLGAAVLVSLLGWVWALRLRRTPGSGRVFVLAAAWWALILAALFQWMRQVEAPHGRLLFPALGAWALLLVGGWAALPPLRRPWLRPGALLLTGMVVLSLVAPWTVIRPAFAPPQLLSPAEAAATVHGPELTYGLGVEGVPDVARLLGITLDRTSVASGTTLAVRACWEALTPMDEDWTVFIHLVGRDDARIAERYTYPGLGRFPTSLWPVGRAFCDVYRVSVEDWAPVPGIYDLVLGLYDASTGERLVARDAAGSELDLYILARVRVAPERPLALPAAAQLLDYRLGEGIALTGYQLSGSLRPGTPLTVTLYWRADTRPDRDYTVFVHLLDGAGELLAQHDGPPCHDRYPTSVWLPGDLVPDDHVLTLPPRPAAQPAECRLVVGMYRPDTLERLPVQSPDGLLPDGLVPLQVESRRELQ
jgi:4-amino-4-deoxy-L-arabinose transferase-like glycosyltransferase